MDPIVFSIFTGDDKVMPLKAQYVASGNSLDLTSCTEISVPLANADGTTTTLTLSGSQVAIVSPAVLGQFNVTIPSSVSALLKVGEFQTVDVTFTISSKQTTVRYFQALSVFQR